jgi:hypothetical protein
MTKRAANEIVQRELGHGYWVWKRNGLFYLGTRLSSGSRKVMMNRYVSSYGYEEVIARAGMSFQKPMLAFPNA